MMGGGATFTGTNSLNVFDHTISKVNANLLSLRLAFEFFNIHIKQWAFKLTGDGKM
jgi:hypothetical protein